jgi:hypothetical protein
MYGSTYIFWAHLTPCSLQATGLDWAGDQLVLPDGDGYGFRTPGNGGTSRGR